MDPNRKDQIVEQIQLFTEQHQYPPTVQQIADSLNLNRSTVRYHLRLLKEDGRIASEGHRTIRVVK